jgi:hypothetical protein
MKLLFYPEYGRGINSIRIYLFTFFVFSIIMIGCTPAPTFIRSDFEQKQIKSVAIMPIIDKRKIIEGTVQSDKTLSNIEELLSKKIMDKNYDVLSPGPVKNILKGKAVENLSPENLCSLLKVDGILFSELFGYTNVFFINHSIKMRLKIYDAKGDSLWINDLDDIERPFLSAIGASAGWAIGVAIDNKVSSHNKVPIILAGIGAAELVYVIVDGIRNETSESIDGVLKSLPDGRRIGREIIE